MKTKSNGTLMSNVIVGASTVTSSFAVPMSDAEGAAIHFGISSIGSVGVTGSIGVYGSCEQIYPEGSTTRLTGSNPYNGATYLPWCLVTSSVVQYSGTLMTPLMFNGPLSYFESLLVTYTGMGGSGSLNARFTVKGGA